MKEQDKEIASALLKKIKTLISEKKTGKIELTLELNMSQGFIGSAYIRNNSLAPKENIL